MSVSVFSLVWDGYPGGGSELLALLALADWSDDAGRCWPSMTNIAAKCRLSRSQAQRVTHELIKAGFLVVEGNAEGGPPGASRRYRIALDLLTGRTHATGSADATGRTHAQDGSHGCAETGRTHATQTVSEPSVNRQRARASISSASALIGFAEFWSAYPRKVSKAAAQKAWAKLNPGALLPELLAALERQKAGDDWSKDGGRFIPHPATWINGRRWEDEPAGSATGTEERASIFAGAL